MAARRLKAQTIEIASRDSSEQKGEPLPDSVLSFATMGIDVAVIRHHDEDAMYRAAVGSPIPIINAGSGRVQHPTQALLDVYTINRELGRLDGRSIALIGDLKYGRTTNSLAYLLTKFKRVKIYLVSPEHLRMKGDLRYYLHEKGVEVVETTDFDLVIDKVDVLYQTRAQKERTSDSSEHNGLAPYIINHRVAERMKKDAIIMHPWPRQEELSRDIDSLPQQKYIVQMRYGVLIRMALLSWVFGEFV